VTTTGGSAMDAVKAVQDAGAMVVLVLSILDRGEGAADLYAKAAFPSSRCSAPRSSSRSRREAILATRTNTIRAF